MMTLQSLRRADAPAVRLEPPPVRRPEVLRPVAGPGDVVGGCGRVRLLGGPFKRAQERAGEQLLAVPTDTLLDAWQIDAGPRAERCARVGSYLSACSLMWAATGEPVYRRRTEHIVGRIAAWLRGTGFAGLSSLGPLRPGLVDARQLAGSELARELLGMLGPDAAPLQRWTSGSDVPLVRAERAEDLLVNTVLATQRACSWPFDAAGLQGPARIGESIFSTDGNVLCVAQYVAAELSWREKGLRLNQLTAFPERSAVRLIVTAGRALTLTLRLRHPTWCRTVTVHVNGQRVLASHEPGRWLDLDRSWRNGDVVDLELPMHLHLAPVLRSSGAGMLKFGPMALVAVHDEALAPRPGLPRLALHGRGPDEVVRRLGSTLRFSAALSGQDAGLELIPCHQAAAGPRGQHFELA